MKRPVTQLRRKEEKQKETMIKSLTKVVARKRAAEEESQGIVEHDRFDEKEEERVVNRVIKSYDVVAGLQQRNSTTQSFYFSFFNTNVYFTMHLVYLTVNINLPGFKPSPATFIANAKLTVWEVL